LEEVVFLSGVFFFGVAFLTAATGSVNFESLLFNLAALLAWMNLVLTALSRALVISLRLSGDGLLLAFLRRFLRLALITALCSVNFLSLRIFFLALAMIGMEGILT